MMNAVVDLGRHLLTKGQADAAPALSDLERVLNLLNHDRAFAPARWPRMLDRKQVAEYLSVSVATVERLVADGIIPPPGFRHGARIVRWDRATLDAALDNLVQDRSRPGKSFDDILAKGGVVSTPRRRLGRG